LDDNLELKNQQETSNAGSRWSDNENEQLLEELKILTQDSKYQVTFFHVDLYEGLPKFLQNIFEVV
jgi:hypothetical protein